MSRPDFKDLKTGAEFSQWYWLKEEMAAICRSMSLPYNGSKFELRDRIIYALDNSGALLNSTSKPKKTSRFNWANAILTLDTVITDNVSFGPNFRNFMKSQIGKRFVCHGDFMDWVRSNSGKTLSDAVLKWQELEDRKSIKGFKRDIAEHNMLSQYVRDFLRDNKDMALRDALRCWKLRRELPAENGSVVYSPSDLRL